MRVCSLGISLLVHQVFNQEQREVIEYLQAENRRSRPL